VIETFLKGGLVPPFIIYGVPDFRCVFILFALNIGVKMQPVGSVFAFSADLQNSAQGEFCCPFQTK
jgi:hypothetical protein